MLKETNEIRFSKHVEYDKTGQTKTYANAKRGSRKGSKGRKLRK